jgi:YD repeat-containing protein
VRFLILSVLVVACQQSKSTPVVVTKPSDARVADAVTVDAAVSVLPPSHIDLAVRKVTTACPTDALEPMSHELFPGCPPAPYTQLFSVCPHGECPKPCRVDFESRQCCPFVPYYETQAITYDAHGQFLAAKHVKGGESGGLLDVSCTYAGDHMATCQYTLDGKPTVKSIAKRDDLGKLIGSSDGESLEQFDSSYTYAGSDVVELEAGREGDHYTYNSKHQLVGVDEHYKRDHTSSAYKYNAAGDVSEARSDGQITTYAYDAKRRPIRVFTKATGREIKLEWDDQDRLTKQTQEDNGEESSLFIFTYTYDCAKS